MTNIDLRHGDCLDVLAELADASVDAVITDPPYGLANTDPAHVADTIVRWVNGDRDYLPGGHGFMGKAWDAFVPPVAVWDECLRVLKPGGHVLAFAGSRTVDLMTLGLRLAGFDIRDSIAWLYGSGFPKSLDVSKAIDKHANAAPLWDDIRAHIREWRDRAGMTNPQLNAALGLETKGCGMARHWTSEVGGQHSIPSKDMWQRLKVLLGWPDCDLDAAYDAVKDGADRPVIGVKSGAMSGWNMDGSTRWIDRDITAPATDAARTWQGWGTALKPAFEPIVVARKPLGGTVAANVLQHGTGALNIDACRVETTDELKAGGPRTTLPGDTRPPGRHGMHSPGTPNTYESNPAGRWPANVVLDETQATALDQQSGETVSSGGSGAASAATKNGSTYGDYDETAPGAWRSAGGLGDRGGASRYFYIAREEPTCPTTTKNAGMGAQIPTRESPATWDAPVGELGPRFLYEPKADASERVRVNGTAHPTVKPLSLMRWLVRLVTPPGGTVLEPFAGSGTTVEACILEGFSCVAIEREADYLPLIRQRIARRRDPVQAVRATGDDAGLFDLLEGESA